MRDAAPLPIAFSPSPTGQTGVHDGRTTTERPGDDELLLPPLPLLLLMSAGGRGGRTGVCVCVAVGSVCVCVSMCVWECMCVCRRWWWRRRRRGPSDKPAWVLAHPTRTALSLSATLWPIRVHPPTTDPRSRRPSPPPPQPRATDRIPPTSNHRRRTRSIIERIKQDARRRNTPLIDY